MSKYKLIYDKTRRYVCRRDYIREMKEMNKAYGYNDITEKQKNEISSLYRSYSFPIDYSYHRFFTAVRNEFSVNYIPEWLYRNFIEPAVMRVNYSPAWEDKNYMQKFVCPEVFPSTIIRNCNGLFFDEQYNPILKTEANEIIKQENEFVLKYSNTCNGEGILHITNVDDFLYKIESYGENYLLQKIVKQHDSLSALNSSSVNIMRIITYRHNKNEYVVLSAHLRIGKTGSFTDNGGVGNTIHVGVDSVGNINEYGYISNGKKVFTSSSGIRLNGNRIPSFDNAKKLVLKLHSYIPYSDLVGWDVTIDCNGNPVILEYNMKSQDLHTSQIVNGPLFGEYSQEVYEKASVIAKSTKLIK